MLAPILLTLLAIATSARSQSFNIDFGPADSVPTADYAAAGIAGTWNAIGVLPPFERAPLVDVSGQSTGAQIYMFGGTQMLTVDVAETAGDDQSLMDDMLIGFCDPVDVCIWVENLVPGDYEVITYALTPGEPARTCPVRVDFGSPGPTDVGGAWPGQHVEGTTYVRHVVTPSENLRIGFHSGTYNGSFQAGMNGFQVRKLGAIPVGPPGTVGPTGIGRVTPNPAAAAQRIEFTLVRPAPRGALEILDLAGRVVWHAPLADRVAGANEARWDGRDRAGARVSAGVYFVRLVDTDVPGASGGRKLVRIE